MASALTLACPVPLAPKDRILLGHGSGGKLSAALVNDLFLPLFRNPVLDCLEDQATLCVPGSRLAFTTDSFVVKPLFFRGGDIGSLAVHGTVNDLAMGGAEPLFLSAGFILEEGFEMEKLRRITESMAAAARDAGVLIVTGDTKVVERGGADGIFINTAGIGRVREGLSLSAANARPGDASSSPVLWATTASPFWPSAKASGSIPISAAIPPPCTASPRTCSPLPRRFAACATPLVVASPAL